MLSYELCKKYRGGYHAIHIWLKKHYGKANKCENKNCICKNPKKYEWSLINGKKHELDGSIEKTPSEAVANLYLELHK